MIRIKSQSFEIFFYEQFTIIGVKVKAKSVIENDEF